MIYALVTLDYSLRFFDNKPLKENNLLSLNSKFRHEIFFNITFDVFNSFQNNAQILFHLMDYEKISTNSSQ